MIAPETKTKNYRISHTTHYRYSSAVSVCHNVIMLSPQPTNLLECRDHRLNIRPVPGIVHERNDMFGNRIARFSLEESHTQLTITAVSQVTVRSRDLAGTDQTPTCGAVAAGITEQTDPNWLQVVPFLHDSPRIQRSSEFAEYAQPCLAENRSIFEAATDLTKKIYDEFTYDKNATLVDTPTKKAFAGRHGVCQDFAHIAVACLRSHGLPARYVSGYLRTIPPEGKERLVGADQSHAWVSVYCGQNLGWIDFDPTNDCVCDTDHVPIAVGRDYSDVVPIKGVFLGGGDPALTVTVDVLPED